MVPSKRGGGSEVEVSGGGRTVLRKLKERRRQLVRDWKKKEKKEF